MKIIYRTALTVAALVLLLPLSARSEIRAGSVEVGAFGGYNFFENSQNLKNQFTYGARLGYNFTKYFGIEGVGEFINTRVNDSTLTEDSRKEGQFRSPMDGVNAIYYHLDLVYHFMPDGKFNPFIVAGFGGANYSPSIETHDLGSFNFGVGAKYWVTDNVALRVDVQDYLVGSIFQETYQNVRFMFGVTYAFGGKAKTEPAPVAKYEPAPPPQKPVVEDKVVILAEDPAVHEKVVAAVAETKVVVLAFEDVHFDFDKSTLTPQARAILKRDIQLLKDNPAAKVRVAGYTSASGTDEYNQKLSERRAKAVQEYLISEGVITRDRLSTIGYGEKNPATYEAAPKEIYSEAAKSNMRVLFEIVVQPEPVPVNPKDRSSTVTPNPEFQALLDRNLAVNREDRLSTMTPPDVTKADVERKDSPLAPPHVTKTNIERVDSPIAVAPSKSQIKTRYTIQIKAFAGKEKTEAMAFVGAMEKERPYRPYVRMETVSIRERGVWHRILVGSFSSQKDASRYMREAKILVNYPSSFIRVINT